jgi:hypothetical protein
LQRLHQLRPVTMASMPWCGMAAWQPWPRTLISKAQVPAITGPAWPSSRRPECPASCAGRTPPRPEALEQPILDHHRRPAFRFLGRLEDEHGDAVEIRVVGQVAAAPSSMAVWPSWPQACILPWCFE